MHKGQEVRSANFQNGAIMQSDGNFVVYKNRRAIFATDTVGKGEYLIMQNSGNLVLYDNKKTELWSTKTKGLGHHVVMQDDGDFVVYDQQLQPIWSIFK